MESDRETDAGANMPTEADRERDAAVATEVMGWKLSGALGSDETGWWYHWFDSKMKAHPVDKFNPTSSLDAAAEVEAEIERRGLKNVYMRYLWTEVEAGSDWNIATASSAARVAAALAAVRKAKVKP